MRSRGALFLALVVLSAPALVACSGDAEPEPIDDGPSASDDGRKQRIRSCKVTAELTGPEAVGVVGKGRAVVGGGGPDAFYEYADDDVQVTAYSEGEDFSPSVTVTVGGATYSTLTEAAGLDIATNGKEAHVDADAAGVDPDTEPLHVVADFTCR